MSNGGGVQPVNLKWMPCLVSFLGAIAMVVLMLAALRWHHRQEDEQHRIEAWQKQVAALKAGTTTVIIWPEPLCLEEFVRGQPGLAAKVTQVCFIPGGKVTDKRFGYVKQFPNLEQIDFEEVWEGTDAFWNESRE